MEETVEEKRIFRTLHLILETQKMIAFHKNREDRSDSDAFKIRDLERILKSLMIDINQDLLPHHVGLFALNLE
ncbi:hypothetical protein ACE193_05910 [Bernardetia sp. OM2101]|uniref:hypothetical protein n=1 Tax=Bernardetia sp. OM2101 TaxID=3344876 RepID=UPI0035CFCF56